MPLVAARLLARLPLLGLLPECLLVHKSNVPLLQLGRVRPLHVGRHRDHRSRARLALSPTLTRLRPAAGLQRPTVLLAKHSLRHACLRVTHPLVYYFLYQYMDKYNFQSNSINICFI